ncbi:GGDEF domain-containing protein [Candidatus Woesearchaeota archaeon]|jgi:diguanylate cyclase (GGDEF)-like protein|nr:GGDEF domain-containing protein [Candidatus Woesearchaeota archaeon]
MAYDSETYDKLVDLIGEAIGGGDRKEAILAGLGSIHQQIMMNDVTDAPNMRQRDEDLKSLENRLGIGDKDFEQVYVAMVDIDEFGHFNKVYGTDTGDKVLMAVVEALGETLRDNDLVLNLSNEYHLHGEEMLALYTCRSQEDAMNVAERLRKQVEIRSKELTGHTVTVSVGVTQWLDRAEHYSNAQARADKYMQVAKTEGRNRTYCGEEDPLFSLKDTFYRAGIVDDLVKKASTIVRSTKGFVGRKATDLYKSLVK